VGQYMGSQCSVVGYARMWGMHTQKGSHTASLLLPSWGMSNPLLAMLHPSSHPQLMPRCWSGSTPCWSSRLPGC
jgi:hypothetical protein